MCTVTFLPLTGDDFILTSNRDVGFQRAKAERPKNYLENGVELYYPKDGKAGGTWIGTSRNNRLICLLNGGFDNHQRKEFYPKSRGLIVKELLIAENFVSACMDIDLKEIEPFTLVVVIWENELRLLEFIWDGEQRYCKELPPGPFIWSSSTLYDDHMKKMRIEWFGKWLSSHDISQNEILEFHKKGGVGNPETDVFMKREKVGTVSITQIVKNKNGVKMFYESF
jgi:uncharacterized protein with NRDE domain